MSAPDSAMPAAERRAQEAVRALPRVPADPAFRARLAGEFATGALRAPERRIVAAPWHRRAPVAWIAVPAAAAAALAVALLLNPGPRWTLAGVSGGGNVVVDGRPVPMTHAADLERALRGGARVAVPEDAELELACGDRMMLVAAAGTEFVLPPAPGRWFGRAVSASIAHGTVRISTLAGFAGSRLVFHTPEAQVEVTGSTLAIIREQAGTCVCVLDGGVAVGPTAGDMVDVPGGMRRFVFADGSTEMAEMRPEERTALAVLHERAAGR
jgi:hypothetical protein